MTPTHASLLFAATLALAGCTTEEAQIRSSGSMGASDTEYVTTAYNLVQLDRQAGQMVAAKAADPRVRDLATQVTAQADALYPGLQAAEKVGGITPPDRLPGDMAAEIDKLRELNGSDFDRQYVADELAAHQHAVDVFKKEDTATNDGAMKAQVETELPAVQSNLDRLQYLSGDFSQTHG